MIIHDNPQPSGKISQLWISGYRSGQAGSVEVAVSGKSQ